jgi:hypothetical protein
MFSSDLTDAELGAKLAHLVRTVTLMLHYHTVVTLSLHCSHTAVSLVLHCFANAELGAQLVHMSPLSYT